VLRQVDRAGLRVSGRTRTCPTVIGRGFDAKPDITDQRDAFAGSAARLDRAWALSIRPVRAPIGISRASASWTTRDTRCRPKTRWRV